MRQAVDLKKGGRPEQDRVSIGEFSYLEGGGGKDC